MFYLIAMYNDGSPVGKRKRIVINKVVSNISSLDVAIEWTQLWNESNFIPSGFIVLTFT